MQRSKYRSAMCSRLSKRILCCSFLDKWFGFDCSSLYAIQLLAILYYSYRQWVPLLIRDEGIPVSTVLYREAGCPRYSIYGSLQAHPPHLLYSQEAHLNDRHTQVRRQSKRGGMGKYRGGGRKGGGGFLSDSNIFCLLITMC